MEGGIPQRITNSSFSLQAAAGRGWGNGSTKASDGSFWSRKLWNWDLQSLLHCPTASGLGGSLVANPSCSSPAELRHRSFPGPNVPQPRRSRRSLTGLGAPHGPPAWGTHCAFVQRKNPATPASVSSARTPAAWSRAPVSSRCAPRGTRGACRNPEQPRTDHRCARLPPALAAGAGECARPRPQLRRADTFPLLQRLVPPSTLPARSQSGQPTGRWGPTVASRVPADQPALLPAHSL